MLLLWATLLVTFSGIVLLIVVVVLKSILILVLNSFLLNYCNPIRARWASRCTRMCAVDIDNVSGIWLRIHVGSRVECIGSWWLGILLWYEVLLDIYLKVLLLACWLSTITNTTLSHPWCLIQSRWRMVRPIPFVFIRILLCFLLFHIFEICTF